MAGFPAAWKDQSPGGETRAMSCSYSPSEILEYLDTCHHHYATREPPGTYSAPTLKLESARSHRTLWIWEARDPKLQLWRIIVGTGASPFAGENLKPKWAWMWAQSADFDEPLESFVYRMWRELSDGDQRDPDS
jgi:hypothetical protein